MSEKKLREVRLVLTHIIRGFLKSANSCIWITVRQAIMAGNVLWGKNVVHLMTDRR